MTEPEQPQCVDCAIVIVTYNSARDIAGLLDSLHAAAAGLTMRIVVVDNSSTDRTIDQVRGYPDVICIEAGANLGYSGGINIGRQHAGRYRTLAILNPDLILEAGALREMFDVLADPGVGLAVPMLLDQEGRRHPSLRREPTLTRGLGDALLGRYFPRRPGWLSDIVRDERAYRHRHMVDWASGAILLISAACDRLVGDWDERFFLYMEEVDYAARVRAAGLQIEYVPQARAYHRGAGSGQSPALLSLMAINRIRYFEKYGRQTRAMWAVTLLHEFLRSRNPSHRAATRAVAQRSTWAPLIDSLKGSHKDLPDVVLPVKC